LLAGRKRPLDSRRQLDHPSRHEGGGDVAGNRAATPVKCHPERNTEVRPTEPAARSLAAFVLVLGVAGTAFGQTTMPTAPPPAAPASPNRGAVKIEMVPSLIVMNAQGASLQGQTLTLTGVAPNSIIFA